LLLIDFLFLLKVETFVNSIGIKGVRVLSLVTDHYDLEENDVARLAHCGP